jgi:hypothetical protein
MYGEMRNAYKILIIKSEGKRPIVRPRCRWGDIKITLKKLSVRAWTRLNCLKQYRVVSDTCEHGNKSLGSINCRELLGKLSDYQHLKDFVPCSQSLSLRNFPVLNIITVTGQ